MKKFSLFTIVILVVILATCLVGCVKGTPIEFTDEEVAIFSTADHGRAEDYTAATLVRSRDELITFLAGEKTDYEIEEIAKFTEEFFEERAVLVLSHSVIDFETYEIKKVAGDGDKLTLQLSRNRENEDLAEWYSVRQTLLSVSKSDVENVTKCSVVTSTVSSSFSFGF